MKTAFYFQAAALSHRQPTAPQHAAPLADDDLDLDDLGLDDLDFDLDDGDDDLDLDDLGLDDGDDLDDLDPDLDEMYGAAIDCPRASWQTRGGGVDAA